MHGTYYLFITVILNALIVKVSSITCYDCRSDDSPCDVGECAGAICVRMETANLDNERRTVHKSCSEEYEETQCKQSTFGSKLITRCACDTGAFCNGEQALYEARLISKTSSNYSLSFLILTTIILLFL
uniref:Uncharacterized protein n=1 Tax=Panagrolaimus sp. PS1159 TaxID=55785 RepID=A0AC35G248_9BILA